MELTKMSTNLLDSMHEARAIADRLQGLAEDWAKAERDYQVANTKEIIMMKEKGLAVTIVNEIVRGMPHIADLKYQRDLSAEVLKANHKLLSVLGDSMSASQSLLKYQSEV